MQIQYLFSAIGDLLLVWCIKWWIQSVLIDYVCTRVHWKRQNFHSVAFSQLLITNQSRKWSCAFKTNCCNVQLNLIMHLLVANHTIIPLNFIGIKCQFAFSSPSRIGTNMNHTNESQHTRTQTHFDCCKFFNRKWKVDFCCCFSLGRSA